jgi:hypothetical protein
MKCRPNFIFPPQLDRQLNKIRNKIPDGSPPKLRENWGIWESMKYQWVNSPRLISGLGTFAESSIELGCASFDDPEAVGIANHLGATEL